MPQWPYYDKCVKRINVTGYNGWNAQIKKYENLGWKQLGYTHVYRGYNNTIMDYPRRRAFSSLIESINFGRQPDYNYIILSGEYLDKQGSIRFGHAAAFTKYEPATCHKTPDPDPDPEPNPIMEWITQYWYILLIGLIILVII